MSKSAVHVMIIDHCAESFPCDVLIVQLRGDHWPMVGTRPRLLPIPTPNHKELPSPSLPNILHRASAVWPRIGIQTYGIFLTPGFVTLALSTQSNAIRTI